MINTLNLKKILVSIVYFSSISFLIYKFYQNRELIEGRFQDNYFFFLLLLVSFIFFQNFIAIKLFIIIKSYSKIKLNILNWLDIYFSGAVFNLTIFLTGLFYKAKKLKDLGLTYTEYGGLHFFNYIIHLVIMFLGLLVTMLLLETKFLILYFIVSIYLILLFLIFFSPNLTIFLLTKIYLFTKINFLKKIINLITVIMSIFLNKKLIKYAVILNILNYIFIITLFYVVCTFFTNITIDEFIVLWSSKLIIEKLFVTHSLGFFNDILIALFSNFVGYDFDLALMIQVTSRSCVMLSSILSLVTYKIFNSFLNNTN